MEETIGSAVFELKLVTTDAENKANQFIKGLTPSLSEASNEAKRLSSNIGDFIIATRQLKDSINTFDGLRGAVSATVEAYNRYEASMNGMKAVAEATGNSISQSMTVIKESTANGLVNQSDAAAAIKNLELYGLSAQQAGELIATLTDAAVYNRQANYSVSEAVRVATEGIRMENSVLSDAAGVQTNIAKMQENYARELGISTDKLTQAQKAQAIYNGFMQEGSTYSGNAAKYTNSLAGSQAKLSSQIEITKSNVGRLFEIFGPLINGLADWLQHNQALATGLVTLGGILAAGGSLVVAVSAATQAISRMRDAMASSSAISSLLTGNIGKFVLTLGAVGAGAAVISTLNSETGAAAKSEERFSVAALLAKKSSDKQKDSLDDTAKSIQKVQDNFIGHRNLGQQDLNAGPKLRHDHVDDQHKDKKQGKKRQHNRGRPLPGMSGTPFVQDSFFIKIHNQIQKISRDPSEDQGPAGCKKDAKPSDDPVPVMTGQIQKQKADGGILNQFFLFLHRGCNLLFPNVKM